MAARQPDPEAPSFDVIEQQRAHEYVTEQIRRQIGLGIIPPGQALPPSGSSPGSSASAGSRFSWPSRCWRTTG